MSGEVTRRSALSGAAVAVVGGIAGFAFARNSAAAKDKRGTTAANAYGAKTGAGSRRLAAVADVPKGGGVVLGAAEIVLTRSATGDVHAFSAICTHQGCPVNRVAAGTIDCPCHGSRFDAATGAVVSGPAPSPLPVVAITVRAGGIYTT